MGKVWLRYTAKVHRSTVAQVLSVMALGPIGVAVGSGRAWFWPVLWITLVFGCLGSAYVLYRLRPRYYIQGENLMRRGRAAPVCSLRTADTDIRTLRVAHKKTRLVLYLDGTKIPMGDTWITSYYEPDGLEALADGLDQSDYVQQHDVADWLRNFAARPTRRKWPQVLPWHAA